MKTKEKLEIGLILSLLSVFAVIFFVKQYDPKTVGSDYADTEQNQTEYVADATESIEATEVIEIVEEPDTMQIVMVSF